MKVIAICLILLAWPWPRPCHLPKLPHPRRPIMRSVPNGNTLDTL